MGGGKDEVFLSKSLGLYTFLFFSWVVLKFFFGFHCPNRLAGWVYVCIRNFFTTHLLSSCCSTKLVFLFLLQLRSNEAQNDEFPEQGPPNSADCPIVLLAYYVANFTASDRNESRSRA